MPNDGTYFLPREPQEQIIARKKEQAETLEALKVIDQIIAHFQQRIDYLDRLDSITGVTVETDPEKFQRAYMVNRLVKQALLEEKDLLEEKLELHDKR
jgi:hypothetical protein